MLDARAEELKSTIAKITDDVQTLRTEIAELESAMSKETNIRTNEKAKNEETLSDSRSSQEAVAAALATLKDFYAKAGEATALVQESSRQPDVVEAPSFLQTRYAGMTSEGNGVIGMLEVILSDFERLEADTAAAEESATKEFDAFMQESKSAKETKEHEIDSKTRKREDRKRRLSAAREDLEGTQKELGAALDTFDKLKPQCIDQGGNYEDRVMQRKQEIESLKEALKVLQEKPE